jgi:HTH-type transcriptional regulator/antitoxin HigA
MMQIMSSRSNHRILPSRAIHPGEVLREELLARRISHSDFAKAIDIQTFQLIEFINGNKSFTETLAYKLEHSLGIPSKFWISMQSEYDHDRTHIDSF